MATRSTQLVVIGGGPGGYAAAFLAADMGMEVTLVDLSPNPGGVCLYRGCIPSKALLHVAKLLTEARHAEQWGITFGEPQIDLDKLRGWKEGVVKALTDGLGQLSKRRKVIFMQGRASFQDATTLVIQNTDREEERLQFTYAIIATGSRPATLPDTYFDSPRILNSTTALDLQDIPPRLLVIGGGYIGLELGSVYAALGSRVSVVEMTDGLLPGADRDLVRYVAKPLGEQFEAMMLKTKVTELTELTDGIQVTLEGPDGEATPQVYDKVLVAIGRRPNASGLGLQNTNVVINERGFIEVNAQLRTAEASIYAIGDVVGEPMLAHKASHEGRCAVEAIAGHRVAFEPQAIPAVAFTDPEIAWCGLTETQARKEERTVEIARFPWAASGRATTMGRGDGLTKLLIDPQTERILGVGLAGSGAGELIAEGVLAIEMGALASDFKLSIHPHPTLSETLMEAAEVFFGQSTHVYRPPRSSRSSSGGAA
ncbi:dihydrolipoyl dehydrogenase [Candidatus Entotheonella serta]|nr:dihydrolipoyl dehydrogenase [Candidatus Entotheonella serta]